MFDYPTPLHTRSYSSTSSTSPAGVDFMSSMSSASSSYSGDSDYGAFSSLSPNSSSVSPASSIQSSPRLQYSDRRLSPVFDELNLAACHDQVKSTTSTTAGPTATELSAYASNIIRNEAYALLALASRIAPAAAPILDADQQHSSATAVGASAAGDGGVVDLRRSSSRRAESKTNKSFTAVVEQLRQLPAHGKVIVTGVGKSGIAGRKLVATFCSLGIQACFLHPLEALHGDLGVICPCSPASPCDALLMISHSGATAELMRLLPIVRPRVRTLVAVTRDPDSVLARGCTHWLDAGTGAYVGPLSDGGHNYTDEADSALPAPTSSVVSVCAVGDALALTLSRLKLGWSSDGKARRQDFLRCHPGGQLGIELGREGRGVEPSGVPLAAAKVVPPTPVSASALAATVA